MFLFSRGTARFGLSQLGLQWAPTPFGPVYLPPLSVSPSLVVGTSRMVASYAGAAVLDSDGRDLGFKPDGSIDLPPLSDLTVQTWYDQSGHGNHCTQATTTNRPRLRSANAWRGVQGLTYDGFVAASGGVAATKKLDIPAGVTLDRRCNTTFIVAAPRANFNKMALLELGLNTTTRCVLFQDAASSGACLHFGSSSSPTAITANRAVRMNPSVIGWRLGASASTIYVDDTSAERSAASAGATSGGTIGASVATGYAARAEIFAVVSYPGVLSEAEVAAITASLRTIYKINVGQDALIVFDGDSGIEGTGDQYLANSARAIHLGLSRDTHAYNMAVHGTTAQTEYNRRVAKWGLINRTGIKKRIAYIRIGANDLSSGIAAATLYSAYWLPYIDYIRSLGYVVIAEPVLPNGSPGWEAGGAKDTARLAFNELIRNGAARNSYTVSDVVTLPMYDEVGDALNTAYFYTDKIHVNNGGYAALAAFATPIVDTALRGGAV